MLDPKRVKHLPEFAKLGYRAREKPTVDAVVAPHTVLDLIVSVEFHGVVPGAERKFAVVRVQGV